MKKILTTILVISTILACMTPAFAAQRDVGVAIATGTNNSGLSDRAYIFDSIGGNKLMDIRGLGIEVKFDTGTIGWARALYRTTSGDVRGYVPIRVLSMYSSGMRYGMFTNYTLKNGDRGSAITNLQVCLYAGDFLTHSDIDGIFGNDTEQAVKEFQRACGIEADGLVGTITKQRLIDSYITYDARSDDY